MAPDRAGTRSSESDRHRSGAREGAARTPRGCRSGDRTADPAPGRRRAGARSDTRQPPGGIRLTVRAPSVSLTAHIEAAVAFDSVPVPPRECCGGSLRAARDGAPGSGHLRPRRRPRRRRRRSARPARASDRTATSPLESTVPLSTTSRASATRLTSSYPVVGAAGLSRRGNGANARRTPTRALKSGHRLQQRKRIRGRRLIHGEPGQREGRRC